MVLTTSPGFARTGALQARLKRDGLSLVRHTTDDEALADLLAQAEYLVAGLPPVNAKTLSAAPTLKAVLKHGVGLDSIDMDACTARGLPVLSTPGANARAVAEMALAGLLAMSRKLVAGHASVTTGGWDRQPGREIGGSTLAIVGFGRIGQQLARIASALDMTVIAYDPRGLPQIADTLGVSLHSLDEVLGKADYVSLHAAGGGDSRGLIAGAQMDRMKPGAILLNYARGSLVDLDALQDRLISGHLGGAALDVYETEPPDRTHPIFRNPRVLFSPHSGADTREALERMGGMVLDDIAALRRGELPERVVNRYALGI